MSSAANTPVRALIVDDEGPARRILTAMLLRHCVGVQVVGEASGLEQARQLVRSARPDLVFLDIELGRGTGFELFPDGLPEGLQVVFVTAYDEYAVRAFRLAATDYLVKPVDLEELRASVERVRDRMGAPKSGGPSLSIQQTGGRRIVPIAQIVRLQAEGSYATIYLQGGEEVLVSRKLGTLLERLEPFGIRRVHRSHAVSLSQVRSVSASQVVLSDGTEVPISRGTVKEVLAAVEGRVEQ